jgi:hypothetical protein
MKIAVTARPPMICLVAFGSYNALKFGDALL